MLLAPPAVHDRADAHFFTVDSALTYAPFFLDYGPLSLTQLFRFSVLLSGKLRSLPAPKRLFMYSLAGAAHEASRANAVYLLAAYLMLCHGRSAAQAWAPFAERPPSLVPAAPWHDASPAPDSFGLRTPDVLRGLARARDAGFFSFEAFAAEEHEWQERVENGDANWLAEGRLLAFAGPHAASRGADGGGYEACAVEDLTPYFRSRGVAVVVRLNRPAYDAARFRRAGIRHEDLIYEDGSNPPEHILQTFLRICESTEGEEVEEAGRGWREGGGGGGERGATIGGRRAGDFSPPILPLPPHRLLQAPSPCTARRASAARARSSAPTS